VIPETIPANNFRAKIDFIEPFTEKKIKNIHRQGYFIIQIGSSCRQPGKSTFFQVQKKLIGFQRMLCCSLGMDKVVFIKTEEGLKHINRNRICI